jgi:hypothetical protein
MSPYPVDDIILDSFPVSKLKIELNEFSYVTANLSSEVLNSLLFFKRSYDDTPLSRVFITISGQKNKQVSVVRLGDYPEITTVSVSFPITSYIDVNTLQVSYMQDYLQIGEYTDEENIVSWFHHPQPHAQVQFFDPVLSESSYFFIYDLKFKNTYLIERRYPEQLSVALAEVGGLIALLKLVSILLKEYHRTLFEKDFSPKPKVQTDIDGTMCLEE